MMTPSSPSGRSSSSGWTSSSSSAPAGDVQLSLDVGVCALCAHERGVPTRPEQQPHRLREDRLARTRLTGDRVQAGGELELRLADQDEVLDAEPTKQRSRGSG